MRRLSTVLVLLLAPLTLPSLVPAAGQNVDFGTPGTSETNSFPFVTSDVDRYQQVYLGSYFGSSPVNVYSMTFYSMMGGTTTIRPGVYDFYLSHTSDGVNGLGTDLAANITSAQSFVASATLSGAVAAGSPLTFVFTAPFLFDPGLGNLLLDVQIDRSGYPDLGQEQGFQAVYETGFTSRAWIYQGTPYADGTPGATLGSGLVTTFGTAPSSVVPEPATVLLLGTGLLGIGVMAWRRREEDA